MGLTLNNAAQVEEQEGTGEPGHWQRGENWAVIIMPFFFLLM